MYLSFFNLREQPFNLTPDPRFLFLSPQHEEALSHFLYGITERKGFIEMTGEVGTGKTILCRVLLERLDESVSTALIFNSYLNEIELLQAILSDLGLTCPDTTRKAHLDLLNHYLLQECAAGRNAVVVVDEAQNLDPTVLEHLRMLSNLETDDGKLLQIVLVGQPELRHKLSTPQMRPLDQRIAVRFHLHGLNRATTQQYVLHRLRVAGAAHSVTFTRAAWTLIYRYCEGLPRRINLLCDRVLMTAYVRGTHRVSASIVRHSWRDLMGSRQPVSVPHPRLAPLLTLVCGGLLGMGVVSVLTSGSLFPGVRDHLRPVFPEQVQALTQYLSPAPPRPQRPLAPVAAPALPAPAFVSRPQPAAIVSSPVEVIEQVTALVEQFIPDGGAFALQVRPDKGRDAVYTAGEKLLVDIVAASDAYLQVDYYQADGKVVHLLPNSLDTNYLEAGETLTLGKLESSFQFEIAPPFGVEMLTVIASQQPLGAPFDVPSVEPASMYLERLTQILGGYQADETVAVAYMRIRTQERVDHAEVALEAR